MLDWALPDEPLGHLLLTGAVQLHRQPSCSHGRGENLRAGLRNSWRQGKAAHKDENLRVHACQQPPHTYRHTATCAHKLISHKDKLMSKEPNYLLRIITFHVPKPCREFRVGMNWIWAPSWYPSPSLSLSPPPSPPPMSSCVTSSAAPSLPGLPFRDGEGEQCWGLHEEELPRDARLHEALQPAHHPRRRTHVEVRHKHIHAHNVHS